MRLSFALALATAVCSASTGCNADRTNTIAVVPKDLNAPSTCEHAGITSEASRQHLAVYWNGPSDPNDVQQQVSLVNRAVLQKSYGLIVSPNNLFAVNAAISHALQAKVPVVVLGAAVPLRQTQGLSYVLTDLTGAFDELAIHLAKELPETSEVMVVGLNPLSPGKAEAAHRVAAFLHIYAPHIQVLQQVSAGSFGQTELATEKSIRETPRLGAIVALDVLSSTASLAAVSSLNAQGRIHIIGCDQTLNLLQVLRAGGIDALVVQDMPKMAELAVRQIVAERKGQSVTECISVPGVLVTAKNVDQDAVQQMLRMDWRPAP